jgi:hypothetical protein
VPLIAVGFATLPVISIASCIAAARPSYQDISAVYFRAEGVTAPIAIHGDEPIGPGSCPVRVVLYVSTSDIDMMGGDPVCLTRPSGKVEACCGATDSTTDDSPQIIFKRLVAVLEKDRFYDIADPSQPTESDGAAFYSIAVMRCGAQPHNRDVSIAFVGPPQPGANTSILSLSIPFKSLPRTIYDAKIVTLFDDFTHAIYQSEWNQGDIW